jgi:3-oxoacyl-[acyl-carrier protein] reductase
MMRLKDRVALITGGAAGIGKATAQRFIEEGAKVIICDVNAEAGTAAAQELGPNAKFHQVDVMDRQAVQEWVDDVVEKYGRVDVLVNNAGILRDNQLVKVRSGELVKQMPEAEFDLVIGVNLKGVFNCAQAVAPHMIRQGSGVILNASSVVGLDGNFGQTNYVATKAAVIGMTKVWARELGRYGVRVTGKGSGRDACPHPAGPPGPAPRDCQRLPLPGVGRVQLYHRDGPAGRWGPRRRHVADRDVREPFSIRQEEEENGLGGNL